MMIDLIIFIAICKVFYLGFWCGNKYPSFKAFLAAGAKLVGIEIKL